MTSLPPNHTTKDWSALEEACLGMRRLNEAIAAHHADDDEWRRLGREATEMARRLEAGPPRDKLEDMATRPHLARLYAGQHSPLEVEVGEEIEFDPFSLAGGQYHPASMGVRFERDGEESVVARVVVHPLFAGPPERVHGGIQALVVDELMGSVNRMRGRQAFTASLTVNLRAPAPLGVELVLRAWLDGVDGRKITILAEGHGPDGLFLDGSGLFISRADAAPGAPAQP